MPTSFENLLWPLFQLIGSTLKSLSEYLYLLNGDSRSTIFLMILRCEILPQMATPTPFIYNKRQHRVPHCQLKNMIPVPHRKRLAMPAPHSCPNFHNKMKTVLLTNRYVGVRLFFREISSNLNHIRNGNEHEKVTSILIDCATKSVYNLNNLFAIFSTSGKTARIDFDGRRALLRAESSARME